MSNYCDYSDYSLLSVRAAVHYFDKETKKWKPADKGISRVQIYKIGPLESDVGEFLYRIVAVSVESQEVVVNTQINSSAFNPKKVEPMFYHWVDESSLIIGLNFASQQEFCDFSKMVDGILAEYHNISKELRKISRKTSRKSIRSSQKIISVEELPTKITFTKEDLTKELDVRKNKLKKLEETSSSSTTSSSGDGHHHGVHRRKSISLSKKKESSKDKKKDDIIELPK